jgi:transcription initiation factor TFIIB
LKVTTVVINHLKRDQFPRQPHCPECGNNEHITDPNRGETSCRRCGFVVMENQLDRTPEWRAFTLDERRARTRVGTPTSLLHYDKGLSTTFQPSKDGTGKILPWNERQKMARLRKWNIRARMYSRERNLAQAMGELTRLADALHIASHIVENAAYLYRKNLTRVRGRSIEGLVAATLYLVCRITGTPQSLKAIAMASHRSRREIARCYRLLQQDTNVPMPIDDPTKYIPQIASKTGLSQLTQNHAINIILQAKTKHAVVGKSPLGMAAAALYLASAQTHELVTQRELAEAAEVTEVTVRNRYKNLSKLLIN